MILFFALNAPMEGTEGRIATPDKDRVGEKRSSSVTDDGIVLPYRDCGSGVPTLVMLHGWAGRVDDWGAQIEEFCPRYRVVVPSLAPDEDRGPMRGEWSVERLGADVAGLLQQLETGPVVFVGHEAGGLVAVEAARRLENTVVAIIGVESFLHVRNPLSRVQRRSILRALRRDFATAAIDLAKKQLVGVESEVIDRVGQRSSTLHPSSALELLESAFDYDLGAALASLSIPVSTINSPSNAPLLDALTAVAPSFQAVVDDQLLPYPPLTSGDRISTLLARELTRLDLSASK